MDDMEIVFIFFLDGPSQLIKTICDSLFMMGHYYQVYFKVFSE